jgi:hypothetical protein
MIEFSLITFLAGDPGISAIAGSRIYPDVIPDGPRSFPAIAIQTVSDVPVNSMAGECGLTYVRVQVSSWARTRLIARNLDEAVRHALSGYSGGAGSDVIQGSLVANRRDTVEPDPENGMARLYGCQRDFLIGFTSS